MGLHQRTSLTTLQLVHAEVVIPLGPLERPGHRYIHHSGRLLAPDVYRLAAGDVLGIWIEGVLGERNVAPPVQILQQGDQTPSVGFPVPVRDNGTISLPNQMQPRIALTLFTGNTVGGILIASPAERAQSARSFFM